jgi:propanol-preferring alcohol dehydrogenase
LIFITFPFNPGAMKMRAMILRSVVDIEKDHEPLFMEEIPVPEPGENQLLIRVKACGVCHTELDIIEGRTPPTVLPVIPGHQVIGEVAGSGKNTVKFRTGDRVGVAWIYSSCGRCQHCLSGYENLCPDFRATGRDADGGYAEYMLVPEDSAYLIPGIFTDIQAAPLLCAGAVGYRSVRLTKLENGGNIGLTGFGASAHIVLQLIRYRYPDTRIFVFARNENERNFARELGAFWTGDPSDTPPEMLENIIDTTPVWKPVIEALRNLKPGGRLVINAIRKEETDKEYLKNLDYSKHLWMEKEIRSVANVTRNDVLEFLRLAAEIPLIPEVREYRLKEANIALTELKSRKIRGAKVLVPWDS